MVLLNWIIKKNREELGQKPQKKSGRDAQYIFFFFYISISPMSKTGLILIANVYLIQINPADCRCVSREGGRHPSFRPWRSSHGNIFIQLLLTLYLLPMLFPAAPSLLATTSKLTSTVSLVTLVTLNWHLWMWILLTGFLFFLPFFFTWNKT